MARDLLSSDSSDSEEGGAQLVSEDLKVNQDFARKFEHNKKREEKQKLEEKLGKSLKRKRPNNDDVGASSDDSTSESEDEGELATADLDSEILATIKAIRSRDPRVYDADAKFYAAAEADRPSTEPKAKDKSMNLRDYHRQNLLNGNGIQDEEDASTQQPLTYNQEQEQLKHSVLKEIHAAAEGSQDNSDGAETDGAFLTTKEKPKTRQTEPVLDVENADKDPETYLSNFMASRAWTDDRNMQPFESDDEEDDRRAEKYEEAYNMRFEDPNKANETLRSHARDMAAKYSVRRDENNPRQKRRDAEKAQKEAIKQEKQDEKARLRKLRIDEVEEKVRRIKRAGGLHTKDLKPEDWSRFVDDDWDDSKWEEEMQHRFGEDYYAEDDAESDLENGLVGKRKNKKPKFDDDLDIKDILPDFEDEDDHNFSLSEEDLPYEAESKPAKKQKKPKDDRRKEARKERKIVEQLVDDQLQLELDHSLPKSRSEAVGFRYRATSPQSFGLTSRDILLADDSNLNQFAGLKKLAAFRDTDKKQKDKKHLGKKARLRKWRKDVFGNEEGLQESELLPSKTKSIAQDDDVDQEEGGVDIVTTGKKKRRRNNKKLKVEA